MECCFLFHTSIPLPTLEQQTEKGADCACPPSRDPLSRIEGDRPLQVGESRHGQSPRLWTAVMACLCSSSLSATSPSPSQLSAPGHLCSLILPGQRPRWHGPCWGLCSAAGSQLELCGVGGDTNSRSTRLRSGFT